MKNIIASLSTLELINKVDLVANELLYSSNDGFLNLTSKNAIEKKDSYVQKFDYEISKIQSNAMVSLSSQALSAKKKEFILKLEKHCSKQILIWIDEEYSKFLDNSFFELSIDKANATTIFSDLIQALNWYSSIKKLSKEEYNSYFSNLQTKFENALKSNDDDFIPKYNEQKTVESVFLELWLLILEDFDKFSNTDFSTYQDKLSRDDLNFFENIKTQIKNISVLDELLLINSALEVANLKNVDEKYQLIKALWADLAPKNKLQQEQGEEEKAKLIKRRLRLFKDKNKTSKEYFKELITF